MNTILKNTPPQLSVIILSYNQFPLTTGPCLQSLAAIDAPVLEIIVVDNGSDQETVRLLEAAASQDPRIRLLLYGNNQGYARGNNGGVELASAEYILLLNSDTLVPEDSLALLYEHLVASPVPCLVGPVTNAAGNEQQIYIKKGSDQESILAQGRKWCAHAGGVGWKTDQLSFFCVAMARQTFQDLHGLDPVFGLGFYEDADFCCRAAQQGLVLQILEKCFVYHQGSASFSRVDFSLKQLLRKNRKQFRARHGRQGEGKHVRLKNLQLLQGYLEQGNGEILSYQLENRMARAHQLCPNNLLKKLGYMYQLRKVEKAAKAWTAAIKRS